MAEVAFTDAGRQRRKAHWLVAGLTLLLIGSVVYEAASKHRLFMPWTLLTLGLVLGFCYALWSEFRAPDSNWRVQLQSPCVFSCQHQHMRLYVLVRLPGMVLLRTARRRFWVFADETSPAAWRQFIMHIRFAR
jgi:hypothetical protein